MFGSCRLAATLGRFGRSPFHLKPDELSPSTAIILCCHFCAWNRPPPGHESKTPNSKSVGYHDQEISVQLVFHHDSSPQPPARKEERTHRAYSNSGAANSKSRGTQVDTYIYPRICRPYFWALWRGAMPRCRGLERQNGTLSQRDARCVEPYHADLPTSTMPKPNTEKESRPTNTRIATLEVN